MGEGQRDVERVLQRLFARRRFGIKPGLETMTGLLEQLGHPERELACIHVAGTNGKGSVCAMLEAILRAAGYAPGVYTSPHLVAFNERIRTAGTAISDAEIVALAVELEAAAAEVEAELAGRQVTFFELTTAMALEHFRRRGTRLVVLETGMGGRLDATNVVTPLLSVITRIDLEHRDTLGPDLESIAREKCGIIKPGRPVVSGAQEDAAAAVIRATARERGVLLSMAPEAANVTRIDQTLAGQRISADTAAEAYGRMQLALLGDHQLENCATALAVVEQLNAALPREIDAEAVREGLAAVEWPGRLQVLQQEPPVLLDGAHNPGAAKALMRTLRGLLGKRPLALVLGMCTDKDVDAFVRVVAPHSAWCRTVPLRNVRGHDPDTLAAAVRARGVGARAAPLETAMGEAVQWAQAEGGAVCIAGSLFLAGDVLALREGKTDAGDTN